MYMNNIGRLENTIAYMSLYFHINSMRCIIIFVVLFPMAVRDGDDFKFFSTFCSSFLSITLHSLSFSLELQKVIVPSIQVFKNVSSSALGNLILLQTI